MNTLALDKILSSDPFVRDVFGGVFPSDKLPREVENYPKAYVANVDKASSPGSHWVAIYFASNDTAEFFDSLGQPPGTYTMSFVTFLDRNCLQWTNNYKTLQSPFSNVCGQYCIYYLVHRCRKINMNTIVQKFTSNRENNDKLVAQFVRTYYPLFAVSDSGQKSSSKYV